MNGVVDVGLDLKGKIKQHSDRLVIGETLVNERGLVQLGERELLTGWEVRCNAAVHVEAGEDLVCVPLHLKVQLPLCMVLNDFHAVTLVYGRRAGLVVIVQSSMWMVMIVMLLLW